MWTALRHNGIALCLLCLAWIPAQAQLTSATADGKVPTDYTNPRQDTIWVFNQNGGTKLGSLTIRDYDAAKTYEWYSFNTANRSWNATPFISNVETVDNLSEGGYMAKCITPTQRDSFVVWLYMNPGFELKLRKNAEGSVIFGYKTCDYTDFLIETATPVVQDIYEYYNPYNASVGAFQMTNSISFSAKSTEASYSSPYFSFSQQFFRIYGPPYKDTRFTFTGSDRFGIERSDDIGYETIRPHAEMDFKLPEEDPASAPVEVIFTDKSENATDWTWRFGDGDSAVYDNGDKPMPSEVKHVYTIPKEYRAVLVVASLNQCYDSTEVTIKVDPSQLDIANVFSPNGDGLNDYFKPKNTSIRQFEISIYTRTGKRVYQHKGGDLRGWEGWDGRINGGKDASDGVYFFVLRAIGWDDVDYGWRNKKVKTDTYRSYLYLYR